MEIPPLVQNNREKKLNVETAEYSCNYREGERRARERERARHRRDRSY